MLYTNVDRLLITAIRNATNFYCDRLNAQILAFRMTINLYRGQLRQYYPILGISTQFSAQMLSNVRKKCVFMR